MYSLFLNGLLPAVLLYSNYAVAHFVQLTSYCSYGKPSLTLDSGQQLVGLNVSVSNDSIRGVASLITTRLIIDMDSMYSSASVFSCDPVIPVSFSFSYGCSSIPLSNGNCHGVESIFCNDNNASISVMFCPHATESSEIQRVAHTSTTVFSASPSLVMQSLLARAPPLMSRVSILAIIIASSVGGGALLLLIVLAFVYRRKVRHRLRQKDRMQEMGQVNGSESIRATTSASMPTSPPRPPRSSRPRVSTSSSRSRRKNKDQFRLMISAPLNVTPYSSTTGPIIPTHQRNASLYTQRSQRSFQSSQSFKTPSSSSSRVPRSGLPTSSRYLPLGLPSSPRDFRPAISRQRSLPRLPSQFTGERAIPMASKAARTEEDLDELEYVSVWED